MLKPLLQLEKKAIREPRPPPSTSYRDIVSRVLLIRCGWTISEAKTAFFFAPHRSALSNRVQTDTWVKKALSIAESLNEALILCSIRNTQKALKSLWGSCKCATHVNDVFQFDMFFSFSCSVNWMCPDVGYSRGYKPILDTYFSPCKPGWFQWVQF